MNARQRAFHLVTTPIVVVTLQLGVLCGAEASRPAVVFDTDMGSDCDDAGALAVLHALADAGELRILGVVFSSGKNRFGVGTCDAINTYYGRGDLRLGQYRGTDVGDPRNSYTRQIATDTKRFGHDTIDEAPDLVAIYLSILESQPDHSVTICTVGHPHGLVHLLRDPRGAELVHAKVDRWVAMGTGGWNFQQMGMSAYCQELLEKWPMPFYISPSGKAIKTGHRLLARVPERNPIVSLIAFLIKIEAPVFTLFAVSATLRTSSLLTPRPLALSYKLSKHGIQFAPIAAAKAIITSVFSFIRHSS